MEGLPPELLLQITNQLSLKDLKRLRVVSTTMHRLSIGDIWKEPVKRALISHCNMPGDLLLGQDDTTKYRIREWIDMTYDVAETHWYNYIKYIKTGKWIPICITHHGSFDTYEIHKANMGWVRIHPWWTIENFMLLGGYFHMIRQLNIKSIKTHSVNIKFRKEITVPGMDRKCGIVISCDAVEHLQFYEKSLKGNVAISKIVAASGISLYDNIVGYVAGNHDVTGWNYPVCPDCEHAIIMDTSKFCKW